MLIQTEIRTGSYGYRAAPQRDMPPICDRPFLDTTKLTGFINPYSQDTEVYGEKEQANYLYKVVSGAVRTYKILENGRRQIAAFYVPGDFFGFETRDQHTLSAETTAQSKLLLINRSTLVALAARDNDIASQLWALTAFELLRVQDHVLSFARPSRERVAGFLVEMAQRLSANDEVELPMKRQDIADYLGLTIETVSRSLTHLENTAAVKVRTRRRIELRNYSALVRLSARPLLMAPARF
jgi:CRP/FNR family nitrogen fixation transcriptional regulator